MTVNVTGQDFGGNELNTLVVLGPSIGTSTITLWRNAAVHLSERFRILGWDLPGHGLNRFPAGEYEVADLADGVLRLVDELQPGAAVHYVGSGLGGAVGLQLLLQAPDRVLTATLLSTGATIGTKALWQERAATARDTGTGPLAEDATSSWFGPDFHERQVTISSPLLHTLRTTEPKAYARACELSASFDATDRLSEIKAPVLAVAGAHDPVTPPAAVQALSDGLANGSFTQLDNVGQLAPAEDPEAVAKLVLEHASANTSA